MVNHFFRKENSVLSAAAVLMTTVFVSRLLGLVRDRFLASHFFGPETAWQLDVYFAAFRLPDMVFQLLVVGALSAAFIPVFTHYLIKDKEEAWSVASTVITLGMVVFLFLAGVIFFLAEPLSRMIAPTFTPVELNLMVMLTRWLLLAQASFLLSTFLTGILQSYQHFLLPALAPIAYNLGIIAGIQFLSPVIGIFGPVVGVIGGAFLHLVIQLPLVQKLGFRYRPSFDIKHAGVRRIGRLMLPRTLALAVSQIELTVAVFIATALPAGSLAIFYFAQHLNSLPVGLFGATIGQAALPALAQKSQKPDRKHFKEELINALNQVLYLSLPAGMMLLILRLPAVRLAFGARSFPWEATLLTGRVVALFAISVFAQAAIQILVRGFYALSNTRIPFVLGSIAVAVNVALSFLLVYDFNLGVMGLALAISLTSGLHLLLLFWRLQRILGGFSWEEFWLPAIKMVSATVITGVFLWVPFRFLDRFIFNTTKTIELVGLSLVTGLIGILVYGLLSYLLKIKELDQFVGLFKKLRHFYDQPVTYP
jgi:putative peptidoglycan lipid II flippase